MGARVVHVISFVQFVPAGDLLAWTANHLQPVCALGVSGPGADLQVSDELVLRHLIPVQHDELQADSGQEAGAGGAGRRRVGCGKVEDERFVVDRVQSTLLDMRLLLGDALSVVHQVHLYVRVCKEHERLALNLEINFNVMRYLNSRFTYLAYTTICSDYTTKNYTSTFCSYHCLSKVAKIFQITQLSNSGHTSQQSGQIAVLHGGGASTPRLAVDMKFAVHIHIHKRLSCVHIATKFARNTAVPERPFPPGISFVKLLKINKSKKNKTYLH